MEAAVSRIRRPLQDHEIPYLIGFGTLLGTMRRQAGITQANLARWAGLSETQVYRLERGVRRTRRSTIERMAWVISLGPDEDYVSPFGDPAVITGTLIRAIGPALAPESDHTDRVTRRRALRERAHEKEAERASETLRKRDPERWETLYWS